MHCYILTNLAIWQTCNLLIVSGGSKSLHLLFKNWVSWWWKGLHFFQSTNIFTFFLPVKPEVRPVPDNGIIVAETGDSVTLACEVSRGNPTPEVTWHRKERKMPSGEDNIRGLSLTYTAVTRHHSGIYICSADNGFGQPSVANLKLDVQREWKSNPDCDPMINYRRVCNAKNADFNFAKRGWTPQLATIVVVV